MWPGLYYKPWLYFWNSDKQQDTSRKVCRKYDIFFRYYKYNTHMIQDDVTLTNVLET